MRPRPVRHDARTTLASNGSQQLPLGGAERAPCALPTDYEPTPPPHFDVQRVYLAKGSLSTPARRRFVERICCSEIPEHPRHDRSPREVIGPVSGLSTGAVRFSGARVQQFWVDEHHDPPFRANCCSR